MYGGNRRALVKMMSPEARAAFTEILDLLANGTAEKFVIHLARRDDSGAPASFRAVLTDRDGGEVFTFLRTPQAVVKTVMERWHDARTDPEIESLLE